MIASGARPKTSVRKALSLSFIQTLVSLVFGFGSVIIVSRILTPAEIGVFSVAAGVLGLVQMLRDFGVTEFLIQEKQLDESMIRTVFTVSVIIAWTLGVVLFASSGALGKFYGHAGVANVLRVLSIVFILLPFGAITQTLMKRDLEFGSLIKIQLAQNITRSCTTVGLAYAGFTYMSMAWSSLVSMVVMVIGCALWGSKHRVKGLGLQHWRRVLHFGSNRTVADIANQVGGQSASLVVGRVLGMTDTGLYSRGYGVVNMFRTNIGSAVGNVAFPAFAREHRENGKAPDLFLKSRVYLTAVSWPFFSAGILLALPIIRVLFGNQWDGAVPLMRWLCAAAIIDSLTYQCDGFLVAVGRVRAATRIAVQYQLARVALTIAAAFVSLAAVAAVQVLAYAIGTVLYYAEVSDFGVLSVRRCIKTLLPNVVVTMATCVVPGIVVLWPHFLQEHMTLGLCAAVAGGCAGWLAAVLLIHHPLAKDLRNMVSRFPRIHRFMYG